MHWAHKLEFSNKVIRVFKRRELWFGLSWEDKGRPPREGDIWAESTNGRIWRITESIIYGERRNRYSKGNDVTKNGGDGGGGAWWKATCTQLQAKRKVKMHKAILGSKPGKGG